MVKFERGNERNVRRSLRTERPGRTMRAGSPFDKNMNDLNQRQN